MKYVCNLVWGLALMGVLGIATGGCGGGGGGGSSNLGLLSGTYELWVFAGSAGTPDEATASWGDIVSDGAGTLSGGTTTSNENGVLSGPSPNGAANYTIDGNRQISLLSGPTIGWTGTVSADGQVAVLASVEDGFDPAILILGRKQGTYNDASLTGLYHACFLVYSGTTDLAYWGSFNFDGAGGTTTGTLTANGNGTIIGPSPVGMTYAVAADGAVTAQSGSIELSGAILAGGEFVVLAGATNAGQPPSLILLTRGTTLATNALLSGSYRLIGLEMDNSSPPSWTGRTFTSSANGAGLLLLDAGGLENEDGTVMPLPGGTGVLYDVAPDGELDFSSGNYFGGVTPSGGFAMFAGQTGSGDDPEFWLMVR